MSDTAYPSGPTGPHRDRTAPGLTRARSWTVTAYPRSRSGKAALVPMIPAPITATLDPRGKGRRAISFPLTRAAPFGRNLAKQSRLR